MGKTGRVGFRRGGGGGGVFDKGGEGGAPGLVIR